MGQRRCNLNARRSGWTVIGAWSCPTVFGSVSNGVRGQASRVARRGTIGGISALACLVGMACAVPAPAPAQDLSFTRVAEIPTPQTDAVRAEAGLPATATGPVLLRPRAPAFGDIGLEVLWSGLRFRLSVAAQAQRSAVANPAFLWAQRGEELWRTPTGTEEKSCVDCHNAAVRSMRGAALRYPRHSHHLDRPITFVDRINLCRAEFMGARALPYDSDEMLALAIHLRHQSWGMTQTFRSQAETEAAVASGQLYWQTKRGTLNAACADCHDRNYGRRWSSVLLSQGQPTAYPAYVAGLRRPVSLHGQFARCETLVGAQPLPTGALDYVGLELYLKRRSAGLPLATPGLRP